MKPSTVIRRIEAKPKALLWVLEPNERPNIKWSNGSRATHYLLRKCDTGSYIYETRSY